MNDNGYVYKNPMTRINVIKSEEKVKKPFRGEEIEKLRLTIPEDDLLMRAMFELLLCSGIRLGGLINLNREDIDFTSMTFKVTKKGNKERICYLNNTAKIHLKRYLNSRNDYNPTLFMTKTRHKNEYGVLEPLRLGEVVLKGE